LNDLPAPASQDTAGRNFSIAELGKKKPTATGLRGKGCSGKSRLHAQRDDQLEHMNSLGP